MTAWPPLQLNPRQVVDVMSDKAHKHASRKTNTSSHPCLVACEITSAYGSNQTRGCPENMGEVWAAEGEPTVTDSYIIVACHHVLQINTWHRGPHLTLPPPPDHHSTGSRKQVLLGQTIRIGAYWSGSPLNLSFSHLEWTPHPLPRLSSSLWAIFSSACVLT